MNNAIVSFNKISYIPSDRLTIQNKFFREVWDWKVRSTKVDYGSECVNMQVSYVVNIQKSKTS